MLSTIEGLCLSRDPHHDERLCQHRNETLCEYRKARLCQHPNGKSRYDDDERLCRDDQLRRRDWRRRIPCPLRPWQHGHRPFNVTLATLAVAPSRARHRRRSSRRAILGGWWTTICGHCGTGRQRRPVYHGLSFWHLARQWHLRPA